MGHLASLVVVTTTLNLSYSCIKLQSSDSQVAGTDHNQFLITITILHQSLISLIEGGICQDFTKASLPLCNELDPECCRGVGRVPAVVLADLRVRAEV